MPILCISESVWPPCLAVIQAHWWHLSLVLQLVSAFWALLHFKVDDNACPWLFRKWVAIVPCYCASSLLTMSVLHSSESEWLQCLAVFWAHSWHLFLAFQLVSGCLALMILKLADHVCAWLFSLWVAGVLCCVSHLLTILVHAFSRMWVIAASSYILSLLIVPVFESPESKFLLCLSVFEACWQCMFFAFQKVSNCHAYCISDLLMMFAFVCLVSEWLPCFSAF